jgi:predicted dehydrogenase
VTLKIAIVGCGKIADGHVEEIKKLGERAELVGVCDREIIMAEQLAERFGLRGVYDDFDRMLSVERPDVVHITTPPESHLALAKTAVAAGAHVFVEKPLTLDYPSSKALVEMVERAGKKLTIGYAYYLDQPALEIRDLMSRGLVGDVVHVESFYGYNLAGPFGQALLGDASHWVHHLPGKLFHNTIDHPFSKIIEFIPDEDPEVHAFGHVQRSKRFGDSRDDLMDELRVVVRGKKVTGYVTFSAHIRPAAHFVRLYGTKNTLHVDYTSRTVAFDANPSLPSAIGRVVPAFEQAGRYAAQGWKNVKRFARSDFHFFAGLANLLNGFYDSIETGGPPPIPYRDILRIGKMMDTIFHQVDQGRWRATQSANGGGRGGGVS